MSKTKIDPEDRQRVMDEARDRHGDIRCAGWPLGSCGRRVQVGGFEIDHIVAEADSTPEQRSDPANLQVLCAPKGKANANEGCHRRKTREEARERAKAARKTRSGTRAYVVGLTGLLLVGYAVVTVLYGPAAGNRFANWSLVAAVVYFAVTITVNVYTSFHDAPPPEEKTMIKETDPAPRAGLDLARITEAFREVVGSRGTVTVTSPGPDEFVIKYPQTGLKDSTGDDSDRERVLDRINAKLEPDRWNSHWSTGKDTVRFTKRPDLPEKVPHPGWSAFKNRPWNIIPIADGGQLDLMKTSHVLVVGATNAGKTSLMRCIIAAAADSAGRGEVELLLLDPKRIELLGFKTGWAGVRGVVTDTWDQWITMTELREEMEGRYLDLEQRGIPLSSHKRLVVIIDEFEDLVLSWEQLWRDGKDPDDDKPLKKTGQRIPPPLGDVKAVLRKARRCGIHLVLGTQSADASIFGGTGARGNLQGRAAVGPINRDQARMAFDDASVGRDLPIGAKGRTTLQVLEGEPEGIQTWWVPDPFDTDTTNTDEDWAILARLGFQRPEAK